MREFIDWICFDILGWSQCDAALPFTKSGRWIGSAYCRKFKGHRGCHITFEGERFTQQDISGGAE